MGNLIYLVPVLLVLLAVAGIAHFRRNGRPLYTYFGRPTPPPFKPPGQWDPAEVKRRQGEAHPAWRPPDYPGQCPICRAMPGGPCAAGLHG